MKAILDHKDVCDLLKLTMLIYNYEKDFIIKDGHNIEQFLDSLKKEENKNLLDNLNDLRKEVLFSIAEDSPKGEILSFISNENTDLQSAVTISHLNKRINVIFRGSESKYDWYYDLQIFQKKLDDKYQNDEDNICVHTGFYKQLMKNNSYNKVLNEVKKGLENYPDYEIFITGHSLGGALCTLFGFLLSHEVSNHITVVSFASPRVGNNDWKEAYDQKENLIHYRISNNKDIVTASPMWGYKHTGNNIRLFEDTYQYYPDYSYNPWWDYSLFNCWSISDHNCDLYYKRLIKNIW